MEEAMSWCGAGDMVYVVHSSSGEDTAECLWGPTKPSVKNLAHTVLATSVEIGKTRIIWNTQAQIISAIYESTFPCLHELSWQCILGEVFLYSNRDIYDSQTTTNPIRYIAPILLFVSESWRPSWILHFEAWGASKLQFTHQKLAQHPENMSNAYITQGHAKINLLGFGSQPAKWRPPWIWYFEGQNVFKMWNTHHKSTQHPENI